MNLTEITTQTNKPVAKNEGPAKKSTKPGIQEDTSIFNDVKEISKKLDTAAEKLKSNKGENESSDDIKTTIKGLFKDYKGIIKDSKAEVLDNMKNATETMANIGNGALKKFEEILA